MAKYSAEELETVRDFMRGAAELSDATPRSCEPQAEAAPHDAETG